MYFYGNASEYIYDTHSHNNNGQNKARHLLNVKPYVVPFIWAATSETVPSDIYTKRSLIKIFTGHILDSQGRVSSCGQRRLRSDCADA